MGAGPPGRASPWLRVRAARGRPAARRGRPPPGRRRRLPARRRARAAERDRPPRPDGSMGQPGPDRPRHPALQGAHPAAGRAGRRAAIGGDNRAVPAAARPALSAGPGPAPRVSPRGTPIPPEAIDSLGAGPAVGATCAAGPSHSGPRSWTGVHPAMLDPISPPVARRPEETIELVSAALSDGDLEAVLAQYE